MRHTVIGLFDTFVQAESARDTLVETGFARDAVELQANPEPSVGSATAEVAGSGVLANIERFLSNLFAGGSRGPDTARYAEAVRRGAVLVCVNAASESHAELARNTLMRLGATDIGERAPDWDPQSDGREHSILDELGIGAMTAGATTRPAATTPASTVTPATSAVTPGVVTPAATAADPLVPPLHETAADRRVAEPFAPPPLAERPLVDPLADPAVNPLVDPVVPTTPFSSGTSGSPVIDPVVEPLARDPDRSAIAAGGAPGLGAVFRPAEPVPEADRRVAGTNESIPNEYLEYEEDFRTHYDEQYSADDARYEDYVPAYRYGAEIAHDERYRDRAWDEVEPEARRHWESTSTDSTWERFKLAIRHGWERVTGHHHV